MASQIADHSSDCDDHKGFAALNKKTACDSAGHQQQKNTCNEEIGQMQQAENLSGVLSHIPLRIGITGLHTDKKYTGRQK